MQDSFTVTAACPTGLAAGDFVDILNTRYEIISVRSSVLTLRPASLWNLLRDQLRSAWLRFRWQIDDAWYELCDIWDETKADWRSIRGAV